MKIDSSKCPPQPPDAPADVPQPSSMFTHDESTPGAAVTQEEGLVEDKKDAEMPEVTEGTGIEPSFGSKTIERPILPSALTERYVDGLGDGKTAKFFASEIPDSDAISPFTSPMKEMRAQEFVGGEDEASRAVDMGGDGGREEMAAVVEGEGSEGKATTNMIGEATMMLVYAESGPDAESKGRDEGDGASFPIMQNGVLQDPPMYGPKVLPELGHISTQQVVLLQNYTLAEDGLSVEGAQQSTSVEIQQAAASEDGGSDDDCGSPTEEVAHLDSPPSDEVGAMAAEKSLPAAKASFLGTALQADVTPSLEEASTLQDTQPTNDILSTKEVPRTEIPASDDDEDPLDEDADPSPTTFEFQTSHGSYAEDHDSLFKDVQATKENDGAFLVPSSTGDVKEQINGDANSAKDKDAETVDKLAPNTEVTETLDVAIRVMEPLQLRISAHERISGSLDKDVLEAAPPERFFSSLVEFPTSLVNLQYSSEADARDSSGAMDVDLPDVPVSTKEDVHLIEVPKSPIHLLGASIKVPSSAASAEPPKTETTSSKLDDEDFPENVASSSVITDHLHQAFPSAEETQASLMSSLPQTADDAREVSSSPPKFEAGKFAPSMFTVTPNASFAAPDGSQIKATGSSITLKTPDKRKTSSTAPNESQGQTKRQSSPKKMADTAKAPLTALVEPPNNDVLFQELKAMKIASIQARNVSLEAEIAAKRAKLEEFTQELEKPAAETVKRHIKLLHDYNDIRDVGQGLVGMIADNRGVRIGELYDEFGVGLKD